MTGRFFHHQSDKPPKNDQGYRSYIPWYDRLAKTIHWGVCLSIIFHLVTIATLTSIEQKPRIQTSKKKPIRIKLRSEPVTPPPTNSQKSKILAKKIPLEEHSKEKIAQDAQLSYQNHRAKRQTRTKTKPHAHPVKKNTLQNNKKIAKNNKKPIKKRVPKIKRPSKKTRLLSKPSAGTLRVESSQFKSTRSIESPRTAYEQLLSDSKLLASAQMDEGYQNYLDQDLPIENAIDINTREYRYIGYFAGLKKAIELAWSYPASAIQKGWDGNVFVHFIINKQGKISRAIVLDSSGHRILDHAIIQAIKLAAPYSPLPDAFGPQLSIKGTFRYVLH